MYNLLFSMKKNGRKMPGSTGRTGRGEALRPVLRPVGIPGRRAAGLHGVVKIRGKGMFFCSPFQGIRAKE
jgi:hypothetical protein